MKKFAALLVIGLGLSGSAQQEKPWKEVFKFTDKSVVGIGFSPDGKQLAVSGQDYVGVFDCADWKVAKELQQYDLVDEAVYTKDGKYLLSRSSTQDVLIHKTPDYLKQKFALETVFSKLQSAIRTHRCPCQFTPDGKWLVLSNGTTGVRFWNLAGLEGEKRKFVFEAMATELPVGMNEFVILPHVNAFAFDQKEAWLGFDDGYVYPIPMSMAEQPYKEFQAGNGGPAPISHEEAERGVAGGKPAMARVYRKPDQVWMFRPHTSNVTSLDFVNGKLVTAGWEGKVKLWSAPLDTLRALHDTRDNEKVKKKPLEPEKSLSGYYLRLSPDKRTLAVAEAWKVKLYDTTTWQPTGEIEASTSIGRPVRIRFADDSAIAVTYCCCTECVDDNVIHLTSTPPKRVHQHGGALVVYRHTP